MKFNYSKQYINEPNHYNKFREIDSFLEKLSEENKDEFSKELYKSGSFMIIGINNNDVIFTPNPEVPDYIESQIRKELKRLYP